MLKHNQRQQDDKIHKQRFCHTAGYRGEQVVKTTNIAHIRSAGQRW